VKSERHKTQFFGTDLGVPRFLSTPMTDAFGKNLAIFIASLPDGPHPTENIFVFLSARNLAMRNKISRGLFCFIGNKS
jgi:hypothetical protein